MKKVIYEYNEINKMRNDWNWNDWIKKWKEKNWNELNENEIRNEWEN
jgi:hypothetical protein